MDANTHSVLDLIGNTPLVPLTRVNPNPRVSILAKVEMVNPGGSVKDRIARAMIEDAEQSGVLKPGRTILEATSGNTGIGLAMVAAVKGYRVLLTMSQAASEERKMILRALGCEIRLTPGHLGTDGAIEEAYNMAREMPDKYFCPDQFNNPANWRAHYQTTGPEIWRQTGGRVTHVVVAMGTTGTLMGVARFFRESAPLVKVIGVEPYLGHKIQGLKNMKESYTPGIFKRSEIDRIINIDDDDAYETARRLAREEGLFVGMSSGAAAFAAGQVAAGLDEGLVVTLLPDGGERYLSTPLFVFQKPVQLRFFNTLSRKKEPFTPLRPGRVTVYTCGPTADALNQISKCRRFVVADLLRRYLEYSGFEVTHVVNISDVDDRTITRSAEAGEDMAAFTRRFTDEFFVDADTLRLKRAELYPKASEHVPDMIEATRKLVEKGFAYEKLRSVYFNISRFAGYGRLSGVDLSHTRDGATVDLDEYEKDNPKDFTLVKRSTLAELKRGIYYRADWGNVRPGWHIECAVMSLKHLGETADIHVASRDLVFPHHENEIAIAEALTGRPFCRFWLHNDPVMVDGKKVSYINQNRITLRDLLDTGWTGREVRFWLLGHHYRKPIHYSVAALQSARRALTRIDEFLSRLRFAPDGPGAPDFDQLLYDLKQNFSDALDDDLNAPAVLAALFRFTRRVNALVDQGLPSRAQIDESFELLARLDKVLMVLDLGAVKGDPEIEALVAQRAAAREQRDWTAADMIRDRLRTMGVELIDTAHGTRWRRRPAAPVDEDQG